MDHFEAICKPGSLNGITTRTLPAFTAGLRGLPGRYPGKKRKPTSIQMTMDDDANVDDAGMRAVLGQEGGADGP